MEIPWRFGTSLRTAQDLNAGSSSSQYHDSGVGADSDLERYVLGSIPEEAQRVQLTLHNFDNFHTAVTPRSSSRIVASEAWRLLLGRALQQGALPGGWELTN